jgi:hypothetical protein
VHEQNYRYVGYFQTVSLTKILHLWEEPSVAQECPIWALKSYVDRGRHTNKRRLAEYLDVEDLQGKALRLEFDARVMKPLRIDELLSAIGSEGLRTMPIGQLVAGIPTDKIFPTKKATVPREYFCAVFENSGPLPEDDGRRKEVMEHSEEEAEEMGFKYSCLELHRLQEAHVWKKGGRQYYDTSNDIAPIRKLMKAIDVRTTLGRWAEYKRTKRDTWVYVKGGAI